MDDHQQINLPYLELVLSEFCLRRRVEEIHSEDLR